MKNSFITFALLFACVYAHAQTKDSIERLLLTQEMNNYYAQAEKIFEAIPKHGIRDVYIGTTLGVREIPTDAVTRWLIQKTCDCTGKVVRIDSLDMGGLQFVQKATYTLDVEWQPSNRFSIRLSGFKNRQTLDSGSLVYSENNHRTTLREPLTINYKAMQVAGKMFFSKSSFYSFYVGAGTEFSYQTNPKVLTNELNLKQTEATPQYARVLVNDKAYQKIVLKPLFLFGIHRQITANWHINYEFQVEHKQKNMRLQTLIPLTPQTWRIDRKRYKALKNHKETYLKARNMDMYLNPDKFPSYDSDGGGSDSGGGDSGGGSSGGGCGGNSNI